jgi:hypothetical protein
MRGSFSPAPFRAFSPELSNAFAAKLDPGGSLLWNGFLGGAGGSTTGTGISASLHGEIVVTGDSAVSWGSPVHDYTGTWTNMYAAAIREPGISVFSPAGNEPLYRGSYWTIGWTSMIPHSEVVIDLMKGGAVVQTIAAATNNDGDHLWFVPPGLAAPVHSDDRVGHHR